MSFCSPLSYPPPLRVWIQIGLHESNSGGHRYMYTEYVSNLSIHILLDVAYIYHTVYYLGVLPSFMRSKGNICTYVMFIMNVSCSNVTNAMYRIECLTTLSGLWLNTHYEIFLLPPINCCWTYHTYFQIRADLKKHATLSLKKIYPNLKMIFFPKKKIKKIFNSYENGSRPLQRIILSMPSL